MSQNAPNEAEDNRLSPTVADPDELKTTIRRRAAEINREELRTAVDQLRSEGELTETQERILQDLTTSILDELLGAPEAMLEDAEELDRSTRIAIIELFDPNR